MWTQIVLCKSAHISLAQATVGGAMGLGIDVAPEMRTEAGGRIDARLRASDRAWSARQCSDQTHQRGHIPSFAGQEQRQNSADETTQPDALVFATKVGTPIAPNNVRRRFIFPACKRLGLPRATW
jgi:hypothetical protein